MSRIGDAFSKGEIRYIAGMSGIELADRILKEYSITIETKDYDLRVDYPAEYWCGWILAYFQWYTGKTFSQLQKKISFKNLMNLYGVLHEADVSKAVEVLSRFLEDVSTRLAKARLNAGLSQSELAKESGVSLRSIQMYEQRNNDINNAQYNRLCAIAKALHCKIEDIIE
ncbi:MAG: helix-turn-helix transcriptional regulator [Tyzzerella sp.]|nr:helix-turn-helix transcriptional regulator [Tyzzerella sp.]